MNTKHRVPGVIEKAAPGYVRDDPSRGYNTYDVGVQTDGWYQSFGGLYLPDVMTKSFEADLMEAAGVSDPKKLVGLKVFALYSFGNWNDPIEGLEFVETGRRFTITGFRRKWFDFKGSPIRDRAESLEREVFRLEDLLDRARKDLLTLRNSYVDWEADFSSKGG